MIRVNLNQSVKSAAGQSRFGQTGMVETTTLDGSLTTDIKKQAFVKVFVMFLFPIALYIYQDQNLPTRYAILDKKKQTLESLRTYNAKDKSAVDEIKRFKEEEAHIQEGISAIEKISKNRLKMVKILDLFQQTVPEKAWLTGVNFRDNKITLNGYASSDYEVTSFVETLAKSVFLYDVNATNTEEESINGVPFKKFEIVCFSEKGT